MEKTEPTIGYESFVKDLDTGDSFTTAIIDILVKVSLFWLRYNRELIWNRNSLNDVRVQAQMIDDSLQIALLKVCVYLRHRFAYIVTVLWDVFIQVDDQRT